MRVFSLRAFLPLLFYVSAAIALPAKVSSSSAAGEDHEELRYVIYLSRHGVRSPTGKPSQYNPYSAAPWPEWNVPPGYLTAHGYELMKLYGAYDRAKLSAQGLLSSSGCADTTRVTILADSDQRTHETGKALAEGMFPGCNLDVHALPEGTNDPLFHRPQTSLTQADRAIAVAAISGRIGGDAANLSAAYRPQLDELDRVLAGCGKVPAQNVKRTSLFDVPASLELGAGDHPATLKGSLSTASTLSENLLLEYTEGMKGNDLAWGCMDEAALRHVLQLHAAAADITERTLPVARMYASTLLDQIVKALEQNASGKAIAGAPGKPTDRVLFLVGHDTNMATVAGLLNLTWIEDGRRDDTPPGSALLFELWRSTMDGKFSIRIEFTAQTLEQMREARPLTLSQPPLTIPIFAPGCSQENLACGIEKFKETVYHAIDETLVSEKP